MKNLKYGYWLMIFLVLIGFSLIVHLIPSLNGQVTIWGFPWWLFYFALIHLVYVGALIIFSLSKKDGEL